jgi:DNA-binding MarR family transcriptional regulator
MASTSTGAEWCVPLINQLARAGRRSAEASMTPGDLRPRHVVALRLLSERGPVSQQALRGLLNMDPSNVVGLLNDLEDRGLTTRRRDPADRRRHIVEISAKGEAELNAANARINMVDDEVLHALSIEERAALYRLLARAVGAEKPPCDDRHDITVPPHAG